jgi:5-methylcytosine-specific restriction endonuclease McrA
MPITIEPFWLLGGLLAVALTVRILVALFRRHRLTQRQRAYREYLRSDVWKRLRREALERDGRRCRLCNAAGNLQVHHRYYPETLGTETCDALTTLCRRCHEEVAHHADKGYRRA